MRPIPLMLLSLSASARGAPVPTARPHISMRDLWGPRLRLATVCCRRTYRRSLPAPAALDFDLVAAATSKPTISHSPLWPLCLSVCGYSNEIDHLARVCGRPYFYPLSLVRRRSISPARPDGGESTTTDPQRQVLFFCRALDFVPPFHLTALRPNGGH